MSADYKEDVNKVVQSEFRRVLTIVQMKSLLKLNKGFEFHIFWFFAADFGVFRHIWNWTSSGHGISWKPCRIRLL